MEQMINAVVAMMKQQAPPEAIIKMLMEKFGVSQEEAIGIMKQVAAKMQQGAGGRPQGQPGEEQGEDKVSAEQALQVLEDAQVSPEHILIMTTLFTQMSLNEVGKLQAAVQAEMQGGGGQPQEQQGPPQQGQSENTLDL